MRADCESCCSTVLDKSLMGESTLHIRVLCESRGLALLLKRVSASRASLVPDLFDDISFEAERAKMGGLLFLRSHEILKSRSRLAEDYEAFSGAARISGIVLKNAAHMADCSRLSRRLRAALDSLSDKNPPPIVTMKFLYLMVRDEGYAVHQDFFPKLPEAKRNLFAAALRTPSSQMREFSSRIESLLESFERWTVLNTDILL